MADIVEFAQQAATRFIQSQRDMPERYNLQLQRGTVEEFIKTAFYASMIPDEGRFPSVCLMSYRRGSETAFHFLFDNSIRPTAQEIATLAHATAPGSHICCICDNGQILLSGIHVTVLNELREFGYGSGRIANPLKLIIRGPGHIEMSSGGIALIYKAGEIREENPFQQSTILRALAGVIEQELHELTSGTVEALEDIFNDLAKAIVGLGHGGLLIVAKEPSRNHFSSLKKLDSLLLQELLIRYWNDIARLHGGRAAGESQDVRKNPHALTVASDTVMLENGVKSIAHLAGVDGAIVMNYSCKVAAFNAIIEKSLSLRAGCRVVDRHGIDRRTEEILRNRGSRHQSALSYIMQVPDSFVFVISQDGGISAFHNLGDGKVICEMGMRVLD